MNIIEELEEARCLYIDIETEVTGDKPSINDIPKFVGFRAPSGKKIMYHISQHEEIQQTLDYARVFASHNGISYDIPILELAGFRVWTEGKNGKRFPKIHLDTYRIMELRAKPMLYLDLSMAGLALESLCERFDLPVKKGHIDYNVFKKNVWTGDEIAAIKEYLYGDLDSGWELLKYLYGFFYGFKHYTDEDSQRKFHWLRSSAGSITYKILCSQAGIPEEYEDGFDDDSNDVRYEGAFVALPFIDRIRGALWCVDFASLYPHEYMLGNLYSQVEPGTPGAWHGGSIFKPVEAGDEDGIRGWYARHPGKIETAQRKIYLDRVAHKTHRDTLEEGSPEWKKYDGLQLATKIVSNTAYGISGSPRFKNVFNVTTASDCTAMARMSIKHARNTLRDAGYIPMYTDSVLGHETIMLKLDLDRGSHLVRFDELVEWLKRHDVEYTGDYSDMKIRLEIHSDVFTPSMNKDRKIEWKRIKQLIIHPTKKQCYRVFHPRGTVDMTGDHSLIDFKRVHSERYEMVEVKPTEATRVIYLDSGILPDVSGGDDFGKMFMQLIGLVVSRGKYIDEWTAIKKPKTLEDTEALKNNLLYPLTGFFGGRVIDDDKHKGWLILTSAKVKKAISDNASRRFVPLFLKNAEPWQIFNFMKGVYASNGIRNRQGITFQFGSRSTDTSEFVRDFVKMLRDNGVQFTESVWKDNGYTITLTKKSSLWWTANVGSVIPSRLAPILRGRDGMEYAQINKVEKLPIELRNVYDIEVEDNHTFFASGVCVHNTDSVYVFDPFNDRDRLSRVCEQISEAQRRDANIYIDTHLLEIEDRIHHMYFFKNDKGEYVKKFYAYVKETKKGPKIVLKGIKLVKGDCSKLALRVYEDQIKQDILDYEECQYSPEMVFQWVKDQFLRDPDQLSKRYRPKKPSSYKIPEGKTKPTSLHYEIACRYGEGEIMLVPNIAIGCGKDKKYCTKEELIKEFGDSWTDYVLITPIVEELKVFIPWQRRKEIKKLQEKPALCMFRDPTGRIMETRNPISVRKARTNGFREISRKEFLSDRKAGVEVVGE